MAHFLRGKQAGIQKDLSEGLSPELFALDDVRLLRLGIPGNFFLFDSKLTYCESSSSAVV